MTTLAQDLRDHLLADATITGLVSTRLYPTRLPDDVTLPAGVYQRIATRHELASGNVPVIRARIQIDWWSTRYLDVETLGDATHAALDMASATGLAAAFPEDDDDTYDEAAHLYRRRLDFSVWRIT